jgi:DNA-binding Lrp family transcriptional regulator
MASKSKDWVRDVDWENLAPRLTLYSAMMLRSKGIPEMNTLATDYAHTAIQKVLSGERAWDRKRSPDLLRHLLSVVSSLISNDLRRQKMVPIELVDSQELAQFPDTNSDGEKLEELAILEGFSSYVQDRDREVHLLLIAMLRLDSDSAAEQADALGMSVEEIYNIRKRLKRLALGFRKKVEINERQSA